MVLARLAARESSHMAPLRREGVLPLEGTTSQVSHASSSSASVGDAWNGDAS